MMGTVRVSGVDHNHIMTKILGEEHALDGSVLANQASHVLIY